MSRRLCPYSTWYCSLDLTLYQINEARIKNGKSTIGWVHPTFYAHPEAFHDITTGYNQGCGKPIAFNATTGWDPVTGLGTPNFAKLKDIFLSLP